MRLGQTLSAADIAQDLRRAGYNRDEGMGTYSLSGDSITVKPGSGSFHSTDGASIDTTGGVVTDALPRTMALRSKRMSWSRR